MYTLTKTENVCLHFQKYFNFHMPWRLFLQPNGPTITLTQQTFSYLFKSQNVHSPVDNSLRMGGEKVTSFFFKNEENVCFLTFTCGVSPPCAQGIFLSGSHNVALLDCCTWENRQCNVILVIHCAVSITVLYSDPSLCF